MKAHRYCVIMCGGVGSRYWPYSRTSKPKQFIDFLGSGKSLLQHTVERISPLVDSENIILVTNRAYEGLIREQLPDIPERNILYEPVRRNTASCVCWAAHHIYSRDPEALILTVPSDSMILNLDAFRRAIEKGFEFVSEGDRLLTIGIPPTYPATGYGYIQKGKPTSTGEDEGLCGIYKVKSFTEKPDGPLAKVFVGSGEFFWNAGIFMWSARSVLDSFARCSTKLAAIFNRGEGLYNTSEEDKFIKENYAEVPMTSVDYAVLEKASNVYVETADIGWCDLGTWKSLYENSEKDPDGNTVLESEVMLQNCRDSIFAAGPDRLVVARGLDGYIVAEQGNALLIYPVGDEEYIRHMVNEIKTKFGEKYL